MDEEAVDLSSLYCCICEDKILTLKGKLPYGQCGTCRRIYDVINYHLIWWPNDQGVEPNDFLLDLGFIGMKTLDRKIIKLKVIQR